MSNQKKEQEKYEEEAWDYVGKRFLKALEKSEERNKEREEFLALRKRLTTPVIGKKEEVGE